MGVRGVLGGLTETDGVGPDLGAGGGGGGGGEGFEFIVNTGIDDPLARVVGIFGVVLICLVDTEGGNGGLATEFDGVMLFSFAGGGCDLVGVSITMCFAFMLGFGDDVDDSTTCLGGTISFEFCVGTLRFGGGWSGLLG